MLPAPSLRRARYKTVMWSLIFFGVLYLVFFFRFLFAALREKDSRSVGVLVLELGMAFLCFTGANLVRKKSKQ